MWYEHKTIQPLSKKVWWFRKKLSIPLSYDPATALLGIYPNELKIYVHLHVNVDDGFIHTSQNVDVKRGPSIAEWINKRWYIYTVKYYSAIKRNNTTHKKK